MCRARLLMLGVERKAVSPFTEVTFCLGRKFKNNKNAMLRVINKTVYKLQWSNKAVDKGEVCPVKQGHCLK